VANFINRREERGDRHSLAVIHAGPAEARLDVVCACGRPVRLRREEDRSRISMSDMLELFRIHIQSEEHGRYKNRADPETRVSDPRA
jgi:hypothetical protein